MIAKESHIYNLAKEAIGIIDAHWKEPTTNFEKNIRRSLELILEAIENNQFDKDFFDSLINRVENIFVFNRNVGYEIEYQLESILSTTKDALYDAREEELLLKYAERVKDNADVYLLFHDYEAVQTQPPTLKAELAGAIKKVAPLWISGILVGAAAFAGIDWRNKHIKEEAGKPLTPLEDVTMKACLKRHEEKKAQQENKSKDEKSL